MSLDELYSLCPKELDAILSAHYKAEKDKKEWDRMLTFTLFNAQGGSENIKTPRDLISFPWDGETELIEPEEINWDEYDKKYARG